jgi:hypothetical protein
VLSDTNFAAFRRLCFALHNLVKIRLGKNDTFTCAVIIIIIKLEGITAHAGEPEGINPAMATHQYFG